MTPPSAEKRDRETYPTPPPEQARNPHKDQQTSSDTTSDCSPLEILHSSKTAPPDTRVRNLPPSSLPDVFTEAALPSNFTRQLVSESPSPPSGQRRRAITTATADGDRAKEPVTLPREPIYRESPRPEIPRTWSTPPVIFQHSTPSSSKGIKREKTPSGIQTTQSPLDSAFPAEPSPIRPSLRTPRSSLQGPVDPEFDELSFRPLNESQSTTHFPPLPFQSYLSLALSAGTTQSTPYPPQLDARGGKTNAEAAYGPPPHHPNDTAALALERLQNFYLLPHKLEGAITFGVLACLDSWLYIFTILPLRFLRGLGLLITFWKESLWDYFNYKGRKLRKPLQKSSVDGAPLAEKGQDGEDVPRTPQKDVKRPRRERKTASDLLPSHKADILRGLVLVVTCWALMRLDASKVYHSIRAQNGIKLYIIYNMLDFADKLCSALGQDIFECLFSESSLERRPSGRSKIWTPTGFLLLALAYNIAHSTVLYYQVITLNVAINSYSNALVTLLLSVQFVELKSSVFKRLDKENLFQMTMADIVERFQLCLMLMIIGARNMVEMGVWTLANTADSSTTSGGGGGIMPKSFMIFPSWTGRLMGPVFLVIGSECLVDWVKHAFVTKFNNIRPIVYERYLDIQCKDFYTHAFSYQNLTKRFGLPVLPLACLFIRSTIQTYHMFLATHSPTSDSLPTPPPLPVPPPTALNLTTPHPPFSATANALATIDALLRHALTTSTSPTSTTWSDSLITFFTTSTFLLACFLIFLALKLVLGVVLLGYARRRYRGIKLKERDRMNVVTGGRYKGATGVTEVTEEVRRRVWEGDEEGRKAAVGREEKQLKSDGVEGGADMKGLEKLRRWEMGSKRIW